MATNQKVLFNAFSQFAGKIGTVLASFIVVKIVSGYGTQFYGDYVTAYEFLAFFGIMADAGLFAIAVRDISQNPKKASFFMGNLLAMRLILILGATLLAGIIAQMVPTYSEWVKVGIWLTGISMGLTIVAGTLSAILQARMKIQYFSGSLVFGKILLAALIFGIATYGKLQQLSPETLFFYFLGAGVISNIIFCSCVYYFAQKEISITLKCDWNYWKKTLRISLPYGLALILQTLYLRVDLILISLLLSASAVGLYGVSARILESFLILGVFFGQAILPKISQEQSSQKKVEKTLCWGAEKLLIFALPIVVGGFIFAQDIIHLLSSPEYTAPLIGSDMVLQIVIPSVFFAFFNQLFSFGLVAKNAQNFLLISNSVALGLNVILNLIFLPKYGIIAAAYSTLLCEILVWLILFQRIMQYYKFRFDAKNLIIIFGLNTILAASFWFTPLRENFFAAIGFGAIAYLLVFGIWRKRFF